MFIFTYVLLINADKTVNSDLNVCIFLFYIVGFETRQGFIDVKSSSVHFYVQRSTSFSTLNTPIPFEVERLNVGRAMNLASGIFTAPKPGIYYFAFSYVKVPSTAPMNVYLFVNGAGISDAHSTHYNGHLTATLHSTLKLEMGDQISLIITNGAVYDDPAHITHFSGFLLEEELVI